MDEQPRSGVASRKGSMREEVRRLMLQAERDLENAAKNIEIEAFEVAAFMCQQAVEKEQAFVWLRSLLAGRG